MDVSVSFNGCNCLADDELKKMEDYINANSLDPVAASPPFGNARVE